LQTVLLTALS